MTQVFWNDWYATWGWFLWFGVILLIFSNVGNWGYTYQAHRKYEDGYARKDAIDLLNERYARGDIKHEEYSRIKSEISFKDKEDTRKAA